MSDKKIAVPEGMLKATRIQPLCGSVSRHDEAANILLEAALRWLDRELAAMIDSRNRQTFGSSSESEVIAFSHTRNGFTDALGAVRRMFLAPEPEVPEEIKDFMWGDWERRKGMPVSIDGWAPLDSHNNQVIEAFRRGQKAAKP